ncbi:MAG: cation diffusion facilitator family transporter [Rhizorhabdus sp.]|jgi:Co/Zn/Cd efflux system component/copper chaperone CopZ|uniref:cation diffusion facilitator family transporter n=1 Tax=Rhizorhabdus sp. TaxID=1968843 RepID=UPI001B5F9FB8|nr:cation diffusion facilitator family transporter [Rhizorhabdus sp.]MBP8231231.1 cation diffusion facilitator family transporter [Rhizorhabdus sp.]
MTQRPTENVASIDAQYRVTGMDCGSCATKIEGAVRKLGVERIEVSIASERMNVTARDAAQLEQIEQTVAALGYRLTRLLDDADENAVADFSHVTPAYRRALWIVVLLNVGYGIIEIMGGFIAGSQALKADALDFLGDGLITFLGILAASWHLKARARAALVQGIFLGALGLWVVAETAMRIASGEPPEAGLMGLFGIIALAVNIAAAWVLVPHRTGDANMQAVWLFSRNDAIGNAAVVVAAGVVALTGTVWPDLIVAFIVAGLFLHSSWTIIQHARRDLAAGRKRA